MFLLPAITSSSLSPSSFLQADFSSEQIFVPRTSSIATNNFLHRLLLRSITATNNFLHRLLRSIIVGGSLTSVFPDLFSPPPYQPSNCLHSTDFSEFASSLSQEELPFLATVSIGLILPSHPSLTTILRSRVPNTDLLLPPSQLARSPIWDYYYDYIIKSSDQSKVVLTLERYIRRIRRWWLR